MAEIRFYHLQTQSLKQALPQILSKAYSTGKAILVKLPEDQVEPMNENLWTYNPNSFLPHGSKKDGNEDIQPIFLTNTDENPNQAKILVTGNGAEPANPQDYDLCCEMLDGFDDAQIAAARTRWKTYKEQGHDITYWQQNEKGGWDQKA